MVFFKVLTLVSIIIAASCGIYEAEASSETEFEYYRGTVDISHIKVAFERIFRWVDGLEEYENFVDFDGIIDKLLKIHENLEAISKFVEKLPEDFGFLPVNFLDDPTDDSAKMVKINMFNLENYEPDNTDILVNATFWQEVNFDYIVDPLESNIENLFRFLRSLDAEIQTTIKTWDTLVQFYDSVVCKTFPEPGKWCLYGVQKKNNGTSLEFAVWKNQILDSEEKICLPSKSNQNELLCNTHV